MEGKAVKVQSELDSNISIRVIPGHFATTNSHINYYIDMITLKTRQNGAAAAAGVLARKYELSNIVDTIVCMEGCEVIGAYLAEALSNAGIMSLNKHETIYVVSPEFDMNGQMIFRDNVQPMIRNKHIILLASSVTTGRTIDRSVECIRYYDGIIEGISAIFSAVDHDYDIDINAIFYKKDIPEYLTYDAAECPFCKAHQKIDAIVNGYGYSKL